jgi:lipoprotein-releasing system permease protein
MRKNFSLFLALRYLKPKRTFVSLITVISILGVTLGVLVLILVISVMTGFERELERKVIGFDAHVTVMSDGPIEDWTKVRDAAAKVPNIEAMAPFVQGPVLVKFANKNMAPKIRAIDPELEEKVAGIKDFVEKEGRGKYDLDGDKVILGADLADILGADVGDTVTVYSAANIQKMMTELDEAQQAGKQTDAAALKEMILPIDLEVTGIFQSGRYLVDSDYMLVPLHIGQEIYGLDSETMVHGISIRATDRYLANQVRDNLDQVMEPGVFALTWMDMNKQIFDAIRMERSVMFFILLFIVLVAAFGIMNTLITVTVQKTREIGIMKALGAQTWQIISVFVSQGVVVGIFGTLTGLVAGITLVQYRNEFRQFLYAVTGYDPFPAGIYQFNKIPAEIVPGDVALICISAFLICSVAALIPAWFASRLDPVKALRYE